MAQDAIGNYVVGVQPSPATPGNSMFGGLSGVGPPDAGLGANGDTYVDLSTGDFYIMSGDVWNLFGGGSGGSGEILAYTTTGPTADGVLPSDLDHEAIAVKPDATTFIWDSTLHAWDDV